MQVVFDFSARPLWPPIIGGRYEVSAPKSKRLDSVYVATAATCEPSRWPDIEHAADFQLDDGRLVLLLDCQLLRRIS